METDRLDERWRDGIRMVFHKEKTAL